MTSVIEDELEEIVRKLMKKEGVTNYKWEIEGQSAPGDNYMGDIIFFKILSENGDKIHDLVMKTAKRSEELRDSVPIGHAYDRELFMYNKIFPEFQKFLVEINANFEMDFIPKLYWSSADRFKETLVFQNLKCDGYKLRDRGIPWNLEHSLFVMEHYAKYHAISLAFQDQRPEVFQELTEGMANIYEEFSKNVDLKQFYTKPMGIIMKLFEDIGRDDLIDKYKNFIDKTVPILSCDIDKKDKIVMTHGDCWNNNFMFKYQDGDEIAPSKVCFLDFQLSSVETPINDLSYNIYTTCDKSCLQHLDLILETYYNTFSRTLKCLGSNPDILFSREKFHSDWRKYSSFGVLIACNLIKILLTPPEDAPDLAKNAEKGNTIEHTFDFNLSLKNEKEYNRRVLDVFTFYGDNYL